MLHAHYLYLAAVVTKVLNIVSIRMVILMVLTFSMSPVQYIVLAYTMYY